MKTLTYKERDLKKIKIEIGFQGENNRKKIQIDCAETFAEYPNAEISMKVQAPKGGIYPATVTREENLVSWVIRDCDVANKGDGEFQITFTEGQDIAKSVTGKFHVERSLTGSGTAPSGVQDWLDGAQKVLEDLEEAEVNQPCIGINGNWYVYNVESGEYVDTGVKAQGEDGDPGQPGTDATPDLITKDYADLTFPVAKDSFCYHDGKLYQAKQAIQTSEQGTSAHWQETTVEEQLNTVKSALNAKIDKPETAGTAGQVLVSDGEGGQEWADNVGITQQIKTALLNCFKNVAWVEDSGETYYAALEDALSGGGTKTLVSISAVYTPGIVYETDSLDSLKSSIVVTALFDDTSTETVDSADYTLSGILADGTATVTVTYEGKTTTVSVTVYGFTAQRKKTLITQNDAAKINNNNARVLSVCTHGEHELKDGNGGSTGFYPVPIRAGITKIHIDQGNEIVQTIQVVYWDTENNIWKRQFGSQWDDSANVFNISSYNNGNYYIAVCGAKDSGTPGLPDSQFNFTDYVFSKYEIYFE